MTAKAAAAAVLAQLTHRNIELQAHGDRLRFRPRSAMTADLAERVKLHKTDLLAILRATDADTPRARAARLIRQVRKAGNDGLAIALRDAWRERLAICEIDGRLSADDAEVVAEGEMQDTLDLRTSMGTIEMDEAESSIR